MNKHIDQLVEAATEVEHSHGAFGEHERYYRLNPQKLAELIIHECIHIVMKDHLGSRESWDRSLDNAVRNIKEHFGVNDVQS